jgi:hypothetical protein
LVVLVVVTIIVVVFIFGVEVYFVVAETIDFQFPAMHQV